MFILLIMYKTCHLSLGSFRSLILSIAIASSLLLGSCSVRNSNTPVSLSGEAQGSYYSIIYYDSLMRDFKPSVDSLLADFDQTASLWVENSLIRRLNDNTDSVVNPLFARLLTLSLEMNGYTNGCFDCTVGGLVNAWGFGFKNNKLPDDSTVNALRSHVGKGMVMVSKDDGTVVLRKEDPYTTIDFNAIAQGYATDMVCRFLENKGIKNYLVDIGGEVYARGCKPDGSDWKIGIERPAQNRYSAPVVQNSIALRNRSVVTSGSYRKYYEKEGTMYSHTINPYTGRPVTHSLLSVSVVDSSAWRADALATAFMVMGLEQSLDFIANHPDDEGAQTVFFIYNQDGEFKTFATPKFRELLVNE